MNKTNRNIMQVSGDHFVLDGQKIILRGFNLGTWMNIENFIMAIPGIDQQIRQAFAEVYGTNRAKAFFDSFINSFMTEEDFVFLSSLGMNVLRIPMNYRRFESDQNPGKYDEEGFQQIDRILSLCAKYKIFAILDMHTAPGGQNPDWHADNQTGICQFWYDASLRARTTQMWSYIANRYKDHLWIAAYDVLNEPALVEDADIFNDFYHQVILEIRKSDPDRVIFLEGNDWAKDFSFLDEPSDPQIAYQFHYYPSTVKYPEQYSRTELDALLLPMIHTLQNKFHRPILLGETGIISVEGREAYYSDLMKMILDILHENGVSWTLWTYKDAHTMGLVYPKEETTWMTFVKGFKVAYGMNKQMRKENDLLTYELDMADDIVNEIEKQHFGQMEDAVKKVTTYRIRAILQYLFLETALKPKLKQIPWDEIMTYPASFAWNHCTYCESLASLLKQYTSK